MGGYYTEWVLFHYFSNLNGAYVSKEWSYMYKSRVSHPTWELLTNECPFKGLQFVTQPKPHPRRWNKFKLWVSFWKIAIDHGKVVI